MGLQATARIDAAPLHRMACGISSPSGRDVYFRLTQGKPLTKLSWHFRAVMIGAQHLRTEGKLIPSTKSLLQGETFIFLLKGVSHQILTKGKPL
jgi:hypothetical protein